MDIQAEKMGLRRLAFMGERLESISGGLGVSERFIQQRQNLRLAKSNQRVPVSRVVEFSFAREVYRELKAK